MDGRMDAGWMNGWMIQGWIGTLSDERTMRQTQTKTGQSALLWSVCLNITGGVNGLKISLDDVMNHAFIA